MTKREDWQEFEDAVQEDLENEFKEVESQVTLPSGGRVDFVAQKNNGKPVTVEAKDKERIGYDDIDQTASYADELDADEGRLYVSNDTQISDDVHEYAEEQGIDIYEIPDWRED